MNILYQRIVRCVLLALTLWGATPAHAGVIYFLHNAVFKDGAAANGAFTFDAGHIDFLNIVTSPGSLDGRTYDNSNAQAEYGSDFPVPHVYLIRFFLKSDPSNDLFFYIAGAPGLEGTGSGAHQFLTAAQEQQLGFLDPPGEDVSVTGGQVFREFDHGFGSTIPVPEPATSALLLIGWAGWALLRRAPPALKRRRGSLMPPASPD
ncbi:hypothetical protein RugamoR64_18520 [Duganella rhizosphaerae]|uniref:PEP-CTERM sorting domain-containing protein n=1 Tax=Duganella rhizosphaerae TaxID=2885763 RepID=UPI0030E84BF3